jgi:hypothetical protein
VAAEIALGEAGWLGPGRLRWARALAWLCALGMICIIAFNLAADASLWLSAAAYGEAFVSRASAPSGARLMAGEGIGAGLYVLTGRVWMSIGMHVGWVWHGKRDDLSNQIHRQGIRQRNLLCVWHCGGKIALNTMSPISMIVRPECGEIERRHNRRD